MFFTWFQPILVHLELVVTNINIRQGWVQLTAHSCNANWQPVNSCFTNGFDECFQNILKLYEMIFALPVSSAVCEGILPCPDEVELAMPTCHWPTRQIIASVPRRPQFWWLYCRKCFGNMVEDWTESTETPIPGGFSNWWTPGHRSAALLSYQLWTHFAVSFLSTELVHNHIIKI